MSVLPATGVPSAESPTSVCTLVVQEVAPIADLTVATLGPAGTSSEAAGRYLSALSGRQCGDGTVGLYGSYELV